MKLILMDAPFGQNYIRHSCRKHEHRSSKKLSGPFLEQIKKREINKE